MIQNQGELFAIAFRWGDWEHSSTHPWFRCRSRSMLKVGLLRINKGDKGDKGTSSKSSHSHTDKNWGLSKHKRRTSPSWAFGSVRTWLRFQCNVCEPLGTRMTTPSPSGSSPKARLSPRRPKVGTIVSQLCYCNVELGVTNRRDGTILVQAPPMWRLNQMNGPMWRLWIIEMDTVMQTLIDLWHDGTIVSSVCPYFPNHTRDPWRLGTGLKQG